MFNWLQRTTLVRSDIIHIFRDLIPQSLDTKIKHTENRTIFRQDSGHSLGGEFNFPSTRTARNQFLVFPTLALRFCLCVLRQRAHLRRIDCSPALAPNLRFGFEPYTGCKRIMSHEEKREKTREPREGTTCTYDPTDRNVIELRLV